MGCSAQKQSCWLLVGTAESWERSTRLAPLCWQPALPRGRRDFVAERALRQSPRHWLLGVMGALIRKGAQEDTGELLTTPRIRCGLWIAPWRMSSTQERGSTQEGEMAGTEKERQPCYNCVSKKVRGARMNGNGIGKVGVWGTWCLLCRQQGPAGKSGLGRRGKLRKRGS